MQLIYSIHWLLKLPEREVLLSLSILDNANIRESPNEVIQFLLGSPLCGMRSQNSR
jgi:hypothetical protein